jgi:hypothetical protein
VQQLEKEKLTSRKILIFYRVFPHETRKQENGLIDKRKMTGFSKKNQIG